MLLGVGVGEGEGEGVGRAGAADRATQRDRPAVVLRGRVVVLHREVAGRGLERVLAAVAGTAEVVLQILNSGRQDVLGGSARPVHGTERRHRLSVAMTCCVVGGDEPSPWSLTLWQVSTPARARMRRVNMGGLRFWWRPDLCRPAGTRLRRRAARAAGAGLPLCAGLADWAQMPNAGAGQPRR